jgi:uncharacterized protein (DUF2345 family)
MTTSTITITNLKALSTTKLIELLSKNNVIVTSGGQQITLMSSIDTSYGNASYGVK